MGKKPQISKKDIIRALLDNYGNPTKAAEFLTEEKVEEGCEDFIFDRKSLYARMERDKSGEYAKAIQRGRAYLVDDTEKNIAGFIKNNDKSMTKFVAETIGKDRGYFKKKALDNKVLGELDMNVNMSGEVRVVIERKIVMSRKEADDFMNAMTKPKDELTKSDIKDKVDDAGLFGDLDISAFMGDKKKEVKE